MNIEIQEVPNVDVSAVAVAAAAEPAAPALAPKPIVRFETRWNEDLRGFSVWDNKLDQWAQRPAFASEHVANAVTRGLNADAVAGQARAKPGTVANPLSAAKL